MKITNDQVHYLVVVGWLQHLSIAYLRELLRMPLELALLALFWMLLAF
jgi:hypothetical protein